MTNHLATLALAATEAEKALNDVTFGESEATEEVYNALRVEYLTALEAFRAAATPSVVLALSAAVAKARVDALTEVHEHYEFVATTEEEFDAWLHEQIKAVRGQLGLPVALEDSHA